VPRGGARQGAGRKPGQMTKMTLAIAEEALKRGVTPLEVMLDNMRFAHEGVVSLLKRIEDDEGHSVDLKVLKELLRLRQISAKWAKAAAPYVHSRLKPVQPKAPSDGSIPLAVRLKLLTRRGTTLSRSEE
jgi:hypothetical protein